jgi:hypothetical protein
MVKVKEIEHTSAVLECIMMMSFNMLKIQKQSIQIFLVF